MDEREPVDRPAVRAVLLDEHDHVLLMRIAANDAGLLLWLTPGGGIEPGESAEAALKRELFEEVGIASATIGPCVWTRTNVFTWKGTVWRALERFHVVRVDRADLGVGAPEEHELDAPRQWLSIEGLRAFDQRFVPAALPDLLERLLTEGPPSLLPDAGD